MAKTRSNKFLHFDLAIDKTKEMHKHQPYVLDILLTSFHVHVNGPEIESSWMGVNNTLEDRFTSLGISHLILKLSKLRDCLQVY